MPKIVDHAQRRAEIATALWQVIHEQGIDGVSFRRVAEAAGVSVGRVQHYFADKRDLVLFGCRHMVDAAVQDHGPDLGGADPDGPASGALEPRRARSELIDLLCATVPLSEPFRIGASVWASYQATAVSVPAIAAIVAEAMTGRVDALATLLAAVRSGAHPSATDRADALRLATLSEGCSQRVLVGALEPEAAVRLIRAETERCLPADPGPSR